ncbi:MAG: extracellular solute-binding protein [Planctomycetota bacterium]
MTSRRSDGTSRRRFDRWWLGLLGLMLAAVGCQDRSTPSDRLLITLWHQMVPAERAALHEEIERFEATHPEIEVRALYKETETLRSAFESSSLAGIGPELVFGASDPMELFQKMQIIQDMSPWFDDADQATFVDEALIELPSLTDPTKLELLMVGDRIGNHLALVYNRQFVPTPPQTTDELVEIAKRETIDADGDGRPERYGLVWNYVEPFFAVPFLTGYGAWLFEEDQPAVPRLDSPEAAEAYALIDRIVNQERVAPLNCDYELADALFKSGEAAMIINGDWSWADYLDNPKLDAAVAVLPTVSSTGLPMAPMVAPKGYSLNANATGRSADAAMEFVKFMTSEEVQRRFVELLRILSARRDLNQEALASDDPTLATSAAQVKRGRAMPVVSELRAVWDSMRPPYQSLLAGNVTPTEAGQRMQSLAERKIAEMNQELEPTAAAGLLKWTGLLVLLGLLAWQTPQFLAMLRDLRKNSLAYLFVFPSIAIIFLTVVFPFLFNIVLSVSNMSMKHFYDWEIVGFHHYLACLREADFLTFFVKTIVWTAVCVFFHVAIGLLLAVALNGPVFGKGLYRVLLILPWAIPAYITALTWRGMFETQYGAVNLITGQWLGLPAVNWLGDHLYAFIACIITNIWLGFPFMMVIALGGMQGIPKELYEAAQIDRVSRWGQFWHITLPMLKPVLLPAVTLGTIWTFNNLNVVWLVSNAGQPEDKTHILVSYVYKSVFSQYRYGYGAALSMIIFAMLLIFSLTLLKRTNATEAVG